MSDHAPVGESYGKWTVRLARAEDVPPIDTLVARAVRALHAGSYDEQVIEEAIAHAYGVDWQLIRDQTYFVAEIAGEVVGAGGWSRRDTLAGAQGPHGPAAPTLDPVRDPARIRAFYVEPLFARAGVGRMLLRVSEKAAARAGFRRAELTATLPAVPFYAAAGYGQKGPYEMSLPSGAALRLILMTKVLPPAEAMTGTRCPHPD